MQKWCLAAVLVLVVGGVVPGFGEVLIGPGVNNGSFELPACGPDTPVVPDGWTSINSGGMYVTRAGDYSPAASDGTQCIKFVNNGVYQTLTGAARTGCIYTLSADYGNGDSGAGYYFKLEAVNPSNPSETVVLIDSGWVSNGDSSQWHHYSATSGSVASDQNGWNLKLTALGSATWSTMDNIRLISEFKPVTNGSFESPVRGPDTAAVPDGWTGIYGSSGIYLTKPGEGRPAASDGEQYLLCLNNGVYQTLNETARTGYVYTLSADYGNGDSGAGYYFKLEAVNPSNPSETVVLIASGWVSNGDSSQWHHYSATSGSVASAQNGWNLKLTALGSATWSTMDNIRLTSEFKPVTNSSFESPACSPDTAAVPDGWTGIYDSSRIYLTKAGEGRPAASDGEQYLLCLNNGVYQILNEAAQTGCVYTLSADYGNGDSGAGYYFKLEAVNPSNPSETVVLIASGWVSNGDSSQWHHYSGTSSPVAAAQNGWNLKLTALGSATWSTMDNIRLTTILTPTFSPKGGNLGAARDVTISCGTPEVTIRYTTDGNDPTETSGTVIAAGATVRVDHSLTLKARAWKAGSDPSEVAVTSFTFPTVFDGPAQIPLGTAAVDGDLADWAEAQWATIGTVYDVTGSSAEALNADVSMAQYAARWSEGKIYVAVRVKDTAHYFTDGFSSLYTSWDGLEIYVHTTGMGPVTYWSGNHIAQQYVVGVMAGDHRQCWAVVGQQPLPAGTGFSARSSLVADGWICYEMEITPFDYFGGLTSETNVISPLSVNDVIGLDVVVVACNGGYAGMKSENPKTGKWNNYDQIGIHKLVTTVVPTPTPTPASIAGDANHDNAVDVSDLGILAAHYGQTSGATWELGDFTGDGAVDVSDLGILAAHYGTGAGTALDFAADAKALGLSAEAKEETPATSTLGCGSAGLPLAAAMRYLVTSGCKRIAHVHLPFSGSQLDARYIVYHQILCESGMSPELITVPNWKRPIVRQTIREYVQANGCPDGMFCTTDEEALAALRGLRDVGKKVPEDVRLVGCNGLDDLEYLDSPISTIILPMEDMCRLAWDFLKRRMKDPDIPQQIAELKATFLVRQ